MHKGGGKIDTNIPRMQNNPEIVSQNVNLNDTWVMNLSLLYVTCSVFMMSTGAYQPCQAGIKERRCHGSKAMIGS